jgi:hypothetical protein
MTEPIASPQDDAGHEDDDEPGGPAHPAPGHLPPASPEPGPGPERDDDEPGGPAHPAPGYLSPGETGSQRT